MTRYTPLWEQQGTYAASQDRRLLSALWPNSGIIGMQVQPSSGYTIQIQPGSAAVPTQNNTGCTLCVSDGVENLLIPTNPAPPAGQSRIDLVILMPRANDLDGGTNNDWIYTSVQGTPAASPVAPAPPAGSLLLATITIPSGLAAIAAGNIGDARTAQTLQVPQIKAGLLAAFRVQQSAGQGVAQATWAPLAYNNTPEYNVGGGGWSGNKYTVPHYGLYRITGQAGWSPTGTTYTAQQNEWIMMLVQNATNIAAQTFSESILAYGTSQWYLNCSVTKICNQGDTIFGQVWQNGNKAASYSVQGGWGTFLEVIELPHLV